VDVVDGVARLVETGAIAGSTLTQDAALRVTLAAGVDLPAAVDALTRAPAAAIGVADRHGSLRPSFAADAVLLDASLAVRGVWLDGRRVH
jgi:N-acetylglucosamine-6-phosphate deacetylase